MEASTLDSVDRDEFARALEAFDDPEVGEMSGPDLFATWAALDAARPGDIELMARVEGDRLLFDEPSPLPVEGDAVIVGGRRIVIRLRQAA